MTPGDGVEKRHAPATLRNRDAIAAVLADWLPPAGTVLEVASGSGEHAVHFAAAFPYLRWQPSDPDPAALASIAAWSAEASLANVAPPLRIDAAAADWPLDRADAMLCINRLSNDHISRKTAIYDACLCINMTHISEWVATFGLFRGCAKLLSAAAPLILYGPFIEADVETASSNLAFDRSLKERNPAWGLRDLADVDRVAAEHGFGRTDRVGMPANNLMLKYQRLSAGQGSTS